MDGRLARPARVLDAPAVTALVDAGFVVIANGGGGIRPSSYRRDAGGGRGRHRQGPRRRPAGPHHPRSPALVIATDVPHADPAASVRRTQRATSRAASPRCAGTPPRALRRRLHGPQVDAICRFVESGGTGVITDLSPSSMPSGTPAMIVVPQLTTPPKGSLTCLQPSRSARVLITPSPTPAELAKLIDDGSSPPTASSRSSARPRATAG